MTAAKPRSLELGSLGLGTAPLSGLYDAVSDDDALGAVRAALDVGVRYFDTAPYYGAGLAEKRLGAVLSEATGADVVVSTKVGRLVRDGAVEVDFSFDGAMRSLEESLVRLNLDRVDILLVHDPGDRTQEAIDGAWRALERLRAEGVVREIGVGDPDVAALLAFVTRCQPDCVLVAGRFTLLDQSALAELLPTCLRAGVRVIAGGVYNSGLLADPIRSAYFDYRPAAPETVDRAIALESVCSRYRISIAAAAVHFPLRHPAVDTVLVGCRTGSEIHAARRHLDTSIPERLWDDLEQQPTSARTS